MRPLRGQRDTPSAAWGELRVTDHLERVAAPARAMGV